MLKNDEYLLDISPGVALGVSRKSYCATRESHNSAYLFRTYAVGFALRLYVGKDILCDISPRGEWTAPSPDASKKIGEIELIKL
jgi:hypothetical protein